MRIALLLLLVTSGLFMRSYAKVVPDTLKLKTKKSHMVKADSSAVDLRTFPMESIKQYQHDPNFNYEENIVPIGWWQQFKHWLYQSLRRILSNKGSALAFKWLLIAAGVAALIFLIYKLSGMDLMAIFGRKAKSQAKEFNIDDEENIHIIDFEEELNQARQNGNFRLAVRLLYLRSLKLLTDQRLIDWQPGKTNHAYLQELRNGPFDRRFEKLTDKFEYIWYGGFSIQQTDFEHIQEAFLSFHQQINPKKALL